MQLLTALTFLRLGSLNLLLNLYPGRIFPAPFLTRRSKGLFNFRLHDMQNRFENGVFGDRLQSFHQPLLPGLIGVG